MVASGNVADIVVLSVFVKVNVPSLNARLEAGFADESIIILSLILVTLMFPLPSKFTEVKLPSVPVSFSL